MDVAATEDASGLAATPVALFQGVDSVAGRARSTAATGGHKPDNTHSGSSYDVCLDATELAKSLHINQSLSVAYKKTASVDQKLDFFRSLHVTTHSVSIVVSARHIESKDTMDSVRLKDGVRAPGTREETADFVRVHGDSFVSSITRGGEYFAVYMFYSETVQEQEGLVSELKAKGLFSVVNVETGLQTKLDQFASTSKTRSSLKQTMSGIKNPKFPAEDKIIAFALEYTSLKLDAPAILDFETEGYERVEKFGPFQPIPANRKYFAGTSVVGGLTADLVRIGELNEQIQWLKATYDRYGYRRDRKLAEAAETVKADLDAIDRQIDAWDTDATQTFVKPPLPSLALGAPSLRCPITYGTAHGGGGGAPFSDFDPATFIQDHMRLVAVQMRSGRVVDAVIVEYDGAGGHQRHEHGKTGGSLRPRLSIAADETVIRIGGRAGANVDRLTIEITGGNEVGAGGAGGQPFVEEPPAGAILIGFRGRSGKYLDQIQAVYATFKPAAWTRQA